MKDDLNDEMPNGTPNILILFYGVLKWDGVSKLGNMFTRDCTTYF
jgi:hypothetical protein